VMRAVRTARNLGFSERSSEPPTFVHRPFQAISLLWLAIFSDGVDGPDLSASRCAKLVLSGTNLGRSRPL